MSTPKRVSATQKKKRLVQLRDAQRRRRERLKDDSQHFVQIILPENVLARLREIVSTSDVTLQHLIGSLIEQSLGMQPAENRGVEDRREVTDAPRPMLIAREEGISYTPTPEESPDSSASENGDVLASSKPINQLDLFG